MVPKAAAPKEALGSLSGGVLLALKASARNSKLIRSVIRNVFPIIRSAFCRPGPRIGLRELLPMVNWGAVVNAATLKNSEALRLAKLFGSLTRFGLCKA